MEALFFFLWKSPSEAVPPELIKQTGFCCFPTCGMEGWTGRFRGGGGPTWRFPQTHLLVLYLHCCGLVYFMSCPLSLIDEHRRVVIISSGLRTLSENLILLFDSTEAEWPSQWGLFLTSIYLLNRVYSDKVDDFLKMFYWLFLLKLCLLCLTGTVGVPARICLSEFLFWKIASSFEVISQRCWVGCIGGREVCV